MILLDVEVFGVTPSVNHYWMAAGNRRFVSAKAKAFQRTVGLLVPAHRSTARLSIDLTLHFPDRRVRDLDNYLKGTLDSLVRAGLCVDDQQFDLIVVRRGAVTKGGLTKIVVAEIEQTGFGDTEQSA